MWTECVDRGSDSEIKEERLEPDVTHQTMSKGGSNARAVDNPPEWLVELTRAVWNTMYDADDAGSDAWESTEDGMRERRWRVVSRGWEYMVVRGEVEDEDGEREATTMWTALGPAGRARDDESDDDDNDEDDDDGDEEDEEDDDEDEWEMLDGEKELSVADDGVDETREAEPTSDGADRSSQREDFARKGDDNDDSAVNDVSEKGQVITIMRSKMTMTEDGTDTLNDIVKSIDETMKKAIYKAARAYKIAELRVRSGVAARFHDVSNVPMWMKRLVSRHVDCLQPRFVFVAIGATGTFMVVRREWLLRAERRSRSSFVQAERLSDDTNREFQEIGLHYIL